MVGTVTVEERAATFIDRALTETTITGLGMSTGSRITLKVEEKIIHPLQRLALTSS